MEEPKKKQVEVDRLDLQLKGFKTFEIGPLVVITKDMYIQNRQIDLLIRGGLL